MRVSSPKQPYRDGQASVSVVLCATHPLLQHAAAAAALWLVLVTCGQQLTCGVCGTSSSAALNCRPPAGWAFTWDGTPSAAGRTCSVTTGGHRLRAGTALPEVGAGTAPAQRSSTGTGSSCARKGWVWCGYTYLAVSAYTGCG